jgi:importin subunit alpha-1
LRAILNIVLGMENGVAVDRVDSDVLLKYVEGCCSGDVESAKQIRLLLSVKHDPPIEHVIDSGVIPKLVDFLAKREHSELVIEATRILAAVASGDSRQTLAVIEAGAVPYLVELLRDLDAQEYAAGALSNIAANGSAARDLVLDAGAMEKLLPLCAGTSIEFLRTVVWTISNLCGQKPYPSFDKVQSALPYLVRFLYQLDERILVDTL